MSAVGPAPSCPESRVPESPSLEFRSPPRPLREDGTPRRVGVEIEFTGPSARIAAAALAAGLGGRLAEEDPHAFRLEGTSLGDLRVELDLRAAHPQRRMTEPGALPRLPVRAAGRSLAALLGPVVPRELITGPSPSTGCRRSTGWPPCCTAPAAGAAARCSSARSGCTSTSSHRISPPRP